MPDLLLELFSEEIPARMQARAAEDLRKMVTDRLVDAGLVYEGAKAFATPRRLALTVQGIPARQPDLEEEKKGPRVGAPEGAIQGFLKSAGLTSIAEATVQKDPKKGDFYVALIEKPGRPALDVLAEILPVVVRTFPWPKSMRWGAGRLTWVRPLHAIVATFGPETEAPDIVPFAVEGIAAGDITYGHRFLAPKALHVKHFDDYVHKLEKAKVVLDPERRKDVILHDARQLAFAQGYELVEDQALLDEVAGLVEWPVVLMGAFDQSFLAMPPEVIRTTIRNNQKCFVLRRAAAELPSPLWGGVGGGGPAANLTSTPTPALRADPPHKGEGVGTALANKFILVANTEAEDGGKAIVAGNERVIRARLADAKFFYETDLKNWREVPLDKRLEKFKQIVFHEKLGTQFERIARIERLADEIAATLWTQRDFFAGKRLGAGDFTDEQDYRRRVGHAARLAKADLLTEVVGEFPELQGLMGKYYALAVGEDASVAAACEDHYKPLGPADRVPTDPVSVAVALADKIDTLVGFWAIGEQPSSSRDPYGLRRATLGIIRIVVENGLRLRLSDLILWAYQAYIDVLSTEYESRFVEWDETDPDFYTVGNLVKAHEIEHHADKSISFFMSAVETGRRFGADAWDSYALADFIDLTSLRTEIEMFFADRLKVQLREQGARHDLVDAVFALEGQDDLVLIVRRVEALGKFLDTEDGKNLLAGTKRATNILRIEEKRDKTSYTGEPDPELYRQAEEWELARAIDVAREEAQAAVAREDFAAAMTAMARLRPHVDAFFDKVTVNVDEADLRANRLKLLNQIRAATGAVADFSKIGG